MLHEDEQPIGRQRSKYNLPSHSKPSKSKSRGWRGIMRKADLTSVFARKHPAPNELIFLIASSIVA